MHNISIARWKGRIRASFSKLLQINALRLNQSWIADDQWPSALLALSQRVGSPKQKDLCLTLMAKSAMVFSQTDDPSGKASVDDPQEIRNGMREVDYLFRKDLRNRGNADSYYIKDCFNWCDKIIADVDYMPEVEAEARKRKKRKITIFATIFSVVAVVIATCIVYNLPYFAERRAYAKVVNDPTGYNIDNYIYGYRNGAHIEEVMRLKSDLYIQEAKNYWKANEEEIALNSIIYYIREFPKGDSIEEARRCREDWLYQIVKRRWDEQRENLTLIAIDDYLLIYPEGRYADSVKVIYDQAWDSLIARYDKSEAAKKAPGRKYMHDMLVFMKEHNTRKLLVIGNPEFDLKEFSEYSPDVQKATIMLNNQDGDRFTIPEDLRTIKDKITVSMAKTWTNDIVRNLNNRFDKLLGYGLIQVVTDANDDCPSVDVNYVIKNQESWGTPDIWTYTETQGTTVVRGALYMGIALDFTADFTIPDSRTSYKVKVTGDPGSISFDNVDASKLYERMCNRCLTSFDYKIATSLGLTDN